MSHDSWYDVRSYVRIRNSQRCGKPAQEAPFWRMRESPTDMNPTADWRETISHRSVTVPLLPLADVVCFPGLLLPFHVSALRDRTMVADALKGSRLIALALLSPGWEALSALEKGQVHKTVCLAHLSVAQPLAEGAYNLVLRGLARAEVMGEHKYDSVYRSARLTIRSDRVAKKPVIDREHRRAELFAHIRDLHRDVLLDHTFHRSPDEGISLSELCDIIAYSLRLPPDAAQKVLEEVDVDLRSDLVLAHLRRVIRDKPFRDRKTQFPPIFSMS